MLSEEEMKDVKYTVEDNEYIHEDERDYLRKIFIKSHYNSINFSTLFLIAYNYFYSNIYNFRDDVRDKILKILSKCNADYVRELHEDYVNGDEIGSYSVSVKIRRFSNENRREMVDVINLFNNVFLGE